MVKRCGPQASKAGQVEELREVSVDYEKLKRMTFIGAGLEREIRVSLVCS